jgi:hypothetical protein
MASAMPRLRVRLDRELRHAACNSPRMNARIRVIAAAALLMPLAAGARGPFTSLHPEEAYPNGLPPLASPGPDVDFIKLVQIRLLERGFDVGLINGDLANKTQTALAQFQIANNLPASGALDDATLDALDIQRPVEAASAASGGSGGE